MAFKPYERIIVEGMLVNDERRDVAGYFLREVLQGPKKGFYLVKVLDVEVFVKPEQVISEGLHLQILKSKRESENK
jgi:hypothetical protein